MKIKTIPEDFQVLEIYDLKPILKDSGQYLYFKLIKRNYSQLLAIRVLSKVFSVSGRAIHFSGSKDRVGVTSQVISIYGISEKRAFMHMEYLNENVSDLHLEYLGRGDERINLGFHFGNEFKVIVRDLDLDDIERFKKNRFDRVLNLYDSQRFGYAGNSHLIGLEVIKGNLREAVRIILSSLPKNPSDEHLRFAESVLALFEEEELGRDKIITLLSIIPETLRDEKLILESLLRDSRDFFGAFRRLPKKLRTLYVNAYQSYVFNEILRELGDLAYDFEEIELVSAMGISDSKISEIAKRVMGRDGVEFSSLNLSFMPELKLFPVKRKTFAVIEDFSYEILEDEIFEKKFKALISFKLSSGEYATNVIEFLFNS